MAGPHDIVDRERRKSRFAQLLSLGHGVSECARMMCLTKGEASRTMQQIRADLGDQAR